MKTALIMLACAAASEPVIYGTKISLLAQPSGFTPLVYEWSRNNMPIADGQTLTISAMGSNDVGTYTVAASDGTGVVNSPPVTLTLDPKPVITSSNLNWMVSRQANVYLSATAYGEGVTWQWRRNGKIIAGATSSTYVIRNVNQNDAGTYRVTARNIHGEDSKEGKVTVVK